MKPATLNKTQIERLEKIGQHLIDQGRAKVIVPPQANASGFWFGGGNMAVDDTGVLWLIGRYRNHGDSRTGLNAGERGLELAVFRSDDKGDSFQKVLSIPKSKLNVGDREVLSIEGAAIRFGDFGVEVFVSTEKSSIGYPESLASYLKPGTGVWTIDRLQSDQVETLNTSKPETLLETSDPRYIHIKDPFLAEHQGMPAILFCSHPFCWTSSNTGLIPIKDGALDMEKLSFDFFPRGVTWDVAMSRGTAVLPLPQKGVLRSQPVSLFFYDGGECVRNLEEHDSAIKRPRGYSCEELGGLAFCTDGDLSHPTRISELAPAFVSPHGTGCSRYVDVLDDDEYYYATWQQSQADFSQPLVLNRVSKESVIEILEAESQS